MPDIMNKYSSIADNVWHDVKNDCKSKKWGDYTVSPEFMFLHTFSHALIKAISHSTGYSMASLRERIYNTDTGYGILIYSNVPGSDSSVGGLTDLITNKIFTDIIDESLTYIRGCSNDPFCSAQNRANGQANGAACYSCIMLPENSCEYCNKFLDRNIWR